MGARRLLVTRPADQAGPWVQRLREAGIDAVALPLMGVAPVEDGAPVVQAWEQLAARDLVMFVSPNAVAQFVALLKEMQLKLGPACNSACATGETPAKASAAPDAATARLIRFMHTLLKC